MRQRKASVSALVPQMQEYSNLEEVLMPYVTVAPMPRFRSKVVNTDEYGYRWSSDSQGTVDSGSWWNRDRRGIVTGGSFTFGVGATEDKKTLVSELNRVSGCSFLNLGVRAANSTQGLIAAIPFLSQCDYVIVCGGFNTLIANIQSIGRFDLYGPFAREDVFARMARYTLSELDAVVGARPPVSLRPITLIRETGRRLRRATFGALRRRRRRRSAARAPDAATDAQAVAAGIDRALAIQSRDLQIIAKSIPPTAQLLYALQPFALVSKEHLTGEEQDLFELRAPTDQSVRHLVYHQFLEIWPRYTTDLRNICDSLGVPFTDLNEVDLDGWCYVDPVHMTDRGYEQIAQHLRALLR